MQIREATIDDLGAVNAVCGASDRPRWTEEMLAPKNDRIVLVASEEGGIVGVAKTHFHGGPDGDVPAGHYLGGIVVTPGLRRKGTGSALTKARMEWVWARSPIVYYFANEHNRASIRMHATLGFRPRGRFAEIRGVTADDGQSKLILFEASR